MYAEYSVFIYKSFGHTYNVIEIWKKKLKKWGDNYKEPQFEAPKMCTLFSLPLTIWLYNLTGTLCKVNNKITHKKKTKQKPPRYWTKREWTLGSRGLEPESVFSFSYRCLTTRLVYYAKQTRVTLAMNQKNSKQEHSTSAMEASQGITSIEASFWFWLWLLKKEHVFTYWISVKQV